MSESAGTTGSVEDRVAATRRKVLDAAHESIVLHGLTRTSMVDVAKSAGVGRTTVYRHWKDLDSLLSDLMTREFGASIQGLPLEPASAEEVAHTVSSVAEVLRASPLLDAIRRHEPALLGRYVFARLGAANRQGRSVLSGFITCATRSDDRLAGIDPDLAASVLLIALQGAIVSSTLVEDQLPDTRWRSEVERLITGYLLT